MRTQLNIHLPRLSDENDFESLLRDICALEWNDPNTAFFGRKGQKQYGVDVYGRPSDRPLSYRGVQCKHRATDRQLSEKEIENEVSDGKLFPHVLDRLVIATDAPRDTNTQIIVDKISEREQKAGGFQVSIWFWDDITERLNAYPQLMVRYYQDLYNHLTTSSLLKRLYEIPVHMFFESAFESQISLEIFKNLQFRGVRLLGPNILSQREIEFEGNLVDGVICSFTTDEAAINESSLYSFLSKLNNYISRLNADTPIFVLLSPENLNQFSYAAGNLGLNISRLFLLMNNQPAMNIADHIFSVVFSHGYKRRGSPKTFNLLVRTHEAHSNGILLDINLQEKLGTDRFPTNDEWETQIVPALRSVHNQIMTQAETPRIQINSQLPLPAAIALGFYFNLRVATVGVWARTIASSEFKRQFWLSDAHTENFHFQPEWFPVKNGDGHHAILEISSYVSIHQSVQTFVDSQNLNITKWGSISLNVDGKSLENIDERMAIAFANSIGQTARQLNSQGILDIHLFARIPSALAVLVGQRLYACGRIHLYWFDNPSYRYAFHLA